MSIDDTLAERGSRYGDFTDHAELAQRFQDVMRGPRTSSVKHGWDRLSDIQKQALTVIADKIARILTGDPNYVDNWHDIQGYSKLVEDRLPKLVPSGTVTELVKLGAYYHLPACAAIVSPGSLCSCSGGF